MQCIQFPRENKVATTNPGLPSHLNWVGDTHIVNPFTCRKSHVTRWEWKITGPMCACCRRYSLHGHMSGKACLPLPLPFLRGGWLHRWWLHPARRPPVCISWKEFGSRGSAPNPAGVQG